LINLEKRNDEIASVCKVLSEPEVEEVVDETVEAIEGEVIEPIENPETETPENTEE
jgi:DNA gyrase subunit A